MSNNNEKKSFEENMKTLENIVDKLNNSQVSMQESLDLFAQGLQCVKQCDADLKNFEDKYNELIGEETIDE